MSPFGVGTVRPLHGYNIGNALLSLLVEDVETQPVLVTSCARNSPSRSGDERCLRLRILGEEFSWLRTALAKGRISHIEPRAHVRFAWRAGIIPHKVYHASRKHGLKVIKPMRSNHGRQWGLCFGGSLLRRLLPRKLGREPQLCCGPGLGIGEALRLCAVRRGVRTPLRRRIRLHKHPSGKASPECHTLWDEVVVFPMPIVPGAKSARRPPNTAGS